MNLTFWCILLYLLNITPFQSASEEENALVKNESNLFQPNWESLNSRQLPKWFDESKIGIFIHWGVYSVPGLHEWFWINWRGNSNETPFSEYMKSNYKPGFTYQDFARDFTGEHFNATEWVQLFNESGAKYVVLTSKHHDGFTMWPSKYSFSWNSVDNGLHRDVLLELSEAIRADNNMRFGIYHSLYEWYNPMYVSDKSSNFTQNEFVDKKILPELKELILNYKPEVLWSDGEWDASYEYWKSMEFLAWLYNESPVAETVVTNDRWGLETRCKHGGFLSCDDNYNPGVIQTRKWENSMQIDKLSWGYRNNAKLDEFKTSKDIIDELVATVSCGGNVLVNIGPDEKGRIEPIFVERLRDMGKWLHNNEEAIYNSQPWIHQNDTTTSNVWYTMSSSPTNHRRNIFAIILDYPYDSNRVELYSVFGKTDENTTVSMLGISDQLKWIALNQSVHVFFPKKGQIDKIGLDLAWTLKIDIPEE